MIPSHRFALALLPILVAGCSSGGPGTQDPTPKKTTEGTPEPAVEVDLVAECQAAAKKWKTLRATFRAEGVTTVVLSLFMERDHRIAITAEPGSAILFDGQNLVLRYDTAEGEKLLISVPMTRLYAIIDAIRTDKPMPAPDAPVAALPPDRVLVDISLALDERGAATRSLQVAMGLDPMPVFGWLSQLKPREGVTVRGEEGMAVVSGPEGRVVLDRKTGCLMDWTLEPPGGRPARIKALTTEVDVDIPEAVFHLDGVSAPEVLVRQMIRERLRQLADQVISRDPARRTARVMALARAYYKLAWSRTAVGELAAKGAARRKESAIEQRRKYPDATQKDIEIASEAAAEIPIAEAAGPEVSDDIRAFAQLTQPGNASEETKILQQLERIAVEEVLLPALERSKKD